MYESIRIAVIGFCVVFFTLGGLSFATYLTGKIINKIKKQRPENKEKIAAIAAGIYA